jgi:hypothetical protein
MNLRQKSNMRYKIIMLQLYFLYKHFYTLKTAVNFKIFLQHLNLEKHH